MQPLLRVKGIREGLLFILGDATWPEVQAALSEYVERQAIFLEGGHLVIDVGDHSLTSEDLGKLRAQLSDFGLSLWAVIANSQSTKTAAQALGLATRLPKAKPATEVTLADTSIQHGENAILVRKTLSPGTKIVHPNHITIIGNVHPGAEIVAGGDVVVWGYLRGAVHAGANGDDGAIVCALDFSPTHLQIAGNSANLMNQSGLSASKIAYVENGRVVISL